MDRLEKFISENQDHFNDHEPGEGHFQRFSERLGKETATVPVAGKRRLFLRVAAAIAILITGSAIVFNVTVNRLDLGAGRMEQGISGEIQDAMHYYDDQTDNRLKEFNRLACCGEEQARLNSMVSSELNAIDANLGELKQALQKDPENEQIQAAIIRNQQMKSQVLDNMIEQIRKSKSE